MSQFTPTVVVKTENGPLIINLTDYDPDKHELVEQEAPAGAPASEKDPIDDMTVPELKEALKAVELNTSGKKTDLIERLKAHKAGSDTPPSAENNDGEGVQMVVAKREDKFFVVDKEDNDVISDLINAEGYETEDEANGAIATLALTGTTSAAS